MVRPILMTVLIVLCFLLAGCSGQKSQSLSLKTVVSPIPVFSIDMKTLQDITADNISNFRLKGSCTEEGGAVTVEVGGVTVFPVCLNHRWEVTLDLTHLSGTSDSTAIRVTHVDGNGASSALLVSISNYTYVPNLESEFGGGLGVEASDRVVVGSFVENSIEVQFDRDWFAVELEANKIYEFYIEKSGEDPLLSPRIYGVHDSTGTLIPNTYNNVGLISTDGREVVIWSPSESGTYYVSVGGYSTSWGFGYTGSYRLEVNELTDHFSADTNTLGRLSVGGAVLSDLYAHRDVDWFALELVEGQGYKLKVRGAPYIDGDSMKMFNPHITGLYDSQGTFVSKATYDPYDGVVHTLHMTFTPEVSGTYYLGIGSSKEGLFLNRNNLLYVASLSQYEDDGLQSLAIGGVAQGNIEVRNDRDSFSTDLVAGETYLMEVKGLREASGTLRDPNVIGIYDSEGQRVWGSEIDTYYENLSLSLTARFRNKYSPPIYKTRAFFTPTTTGTYSVEVTSYDNLLNRVGCYDLTESQKIPVLLLPLFNNPLYSPPSSAFTTPPVEDGDRIGTYQLSLFHAPLLESDFSEDVDTEGLVAVGGLLKSVINHHSSNSWRDRDRDWIAVNLVKDGNYVIDMEGESTGAGTLRYPAIYGVYDSQGTLVGQRQTYYYHKGFGGNSRFLFTASESGTYYIEVGVWSDENRYQPLPLSGGSYVLSVNTYEDDHVSAPPLDISQYPPRIAEENKHLLSSISSFELGQPVLGELRIGRDMDWISVTLEANKEYTARIKGTATGGGTLKEPVFYGVFNPNGDFIPRTTHNFFYNGYFIDGFVRFVAPMDGAYYFSAHGFSGGIGSYIIEVHEVAE